MACSEEVNKKVQCSFPLHFWLFVAAVVFVVVAVAAAVVVGAIDVAEVEPGRNVPAGFAEFDKNCQRSPKPMKVIQKNSFDEIR